MKITHILISKNGDWGDVIQNLATLYSDQGPVEVREVEDHHLEFPVPVPNLNPSDDCFDDGKFLKVGKRDGKTTAAVISARGGMPGHTLLYQDESKGLTPEDAVVLYCKQINRHLSQFGGRPLTIEAMEKDNDSARLGSRE